MEQKVLITGTGREAALGFNLVRRYLEEEMSCSPVSESILLENPDNFAPAMNVGAVGPLRVIQTFLPLLEKSCIRSLIVNVSSEAGSIGACYRSNMADYAVTKASLNMITKTLWNAFKEAGKNIGIFALHPGWMRTNAGNEKAPLIPYEHAENLRRLFEEKRNNPGKDLFITYENESYPW